MTQEELFNALYIEPETGLLTERAWMTLREKSSTGWVLAINLGFLVDDKVSDALGQDVANEALCLLGSVFQKQGGQAVCASHPHPDQLTACHADRAVLEDLAAGICEVAGKVAIYILEPDGSAVIQRGLDFKFATGEGYREADVASLRAGDRGALERHPPGATTKRFAALRREEFLLLDGAAMVAERSRELAERRSPLLAGDATETEWPEGAEEALSAAISRKAYFATASAILSSAARRAISSRRAERILEPTSAVKGMTTVTQTDGQSASFVSHASMYDVYEGRRSIGDLTYAQQGELIRAVFDKDADFRKLVVRQDVLKAQAEGLWTLVVLLGMGLQSLGAIRDFDQRTHDDVKRIVALLAGTQLGLRVASAYNAEGGTQVSYDWSELQDAAIETIMSEQAGEPLSVVRPKILKVLGPVSGPTGRAQRTAPPPLPQRRAVPNSVGSSSRLSVEQSRVLPRWWERLPEAVRWILFLPAVFAVVFVANLIQVFGFWLFNRESVFWAMATGAAFSSFIFFPVVFGLAPRGKRVVGWILYVPVMLFCAAALLLLSAKRLGSWGLLGEALRAPPDFEWSMTDTGEIAQSLIWLVLGTVSFRKCLAESRTAPATAPTRGRAGLP